MIIGNTRGFIRAKALATVQDDIDPLKTSVSEGKSLIAAAVTDKGVETAADATFQTIAENIESIETGISINGTLDNFSVSDGFSVQKGDFVECVDNVSFIIDPQMGDIIFASNKGSIQTRKKIELTDTKILYIYTDGVYGNNATYAIICTLSSSGLSFGTPVQLSASADTYGYNDACRISDNYCIIEYVHYNDSKEEYLSTCRILNCSNSQALTLGSSIQIIASSSDLNSACLVDNVNIYENGTYPIMLVKCANLDHTFSDNTGGSGLYMIRLHVNISSSTIQILERTRLCKWYISANTCSGIYDKNTGQLFLIYLDKQTSGYSNCYITYRIYNGGSFIGNGKLPGINYSSNDMPYVTSSLYVNIDPQLSIMHMVRYQALNGAYYQNYYNCFKITAGGVSLIQNSGASGTLTGIETDHIGRFSFDFVLVGENTNIRYLVYFDSSSMGNGSTCFTKLNVENDVVTMLETTQTSPVKVYYPTFNPLTETTFALTYPKTSSGITDTTNMNYLEIFSEVHNKHIQEITSETPGTSVGIANESGESGSTIAVYVQTK